MSANRPIHILFLCTGNSCRSQMAEAWAKHLGKGIVEARSAGIEAHGLNPAAVEVMAESGIDISAQQSSLIDEQMTHWADLLVTVCADADRRCPVPTEQCEKLHWPIVDPAKASPTDGQVADMFRRTRDEIKQRVDMLIKGLKLYRFSQ